MNEKLSEENVRSRINSLSHKNCESNVKKISKIPSGKNTLFIIF